MRLLIRNALYDRDIAVLPALPISKVLFDLALLNQFPECKVKTADELSVVAISSAKRPTNARPFSQLSITITFSNWLKD